MRGKKMANTIAVAVVKSISVIASESRLKECSWRQFLILLSLI